MPLREGLSPSPLCSKYLARGQTPDQTWVYVHICAPLSPVLVLPVLWQLLEGGTECPQKSQLTTEGEAFYEGTVAAGCCDLASSDTLGIDHFTLDGVTEA